MSEPRPLGCDEMMSRIDDYVDRALSQDETAQIMAHLEQCADCASEYRFYGGLYDQIRAKLQRLELPGDLQARITSRLGNSED